MRHLLKCEFKKFKGTFINSLSILGMLSPLMLVTLMYVLRKKWYISAGEYNWDTFNANLNMLFIFMVGPIISSFIAVFSIFYEYHGKTMKNLLASPHSRLAIITSKLIYVSVFILLQYALVSLLNILIALILGFDLTWASIYKYTSYLMVAGGFTLILVPLMMFISLISKSFIPALMLTVVGTLSNVLVLNWKHSYVSPWSLPADFLFIMQGNLFMDVNRPIISSILYIITFLLCCTLYFSHSDQPS